MMFDRNRVEMLKKRYRGGMRIRLNRMDDMQAPPIGTEGTVLGVDDIGNILIEWDNGSGLNLVPEEDDFEIIR